MKKLGVLITALTVMIMFSIGCSQKGSENGELHAEQNKPAKAENSGPYKITFVEIGSVNCIPCKMMQPVMKKIKNKYGSQVKIIFHDVWTTEGRPYGQKYGIRAIPTQVFLDQKGKEYFRHEGFFPFEKVEEILKKGGVQ